MNHFYSLCIDAGDLSRAHLIRAMTPPHEAFVEDMQSNLDSRSLSDLILEIELLVFSQLNEDALHRVKQSVSKLLKECQQSYLSYASYFAKSPISTKELHISSFQLDPLKRWPRMILLFQRFGVDWLEDEIQVAKDLAMKISQKSTDTNGDLLASCLWILIILLGIIIVFFVARACSVSGKTIF